MISLVQTETRHRFSGVIDTTRTLQDEGIVFCITRRPISSNVHVPDVLGSKSPIGSYTGR